MNHWELIEFYQALNEVSGRLKHRANFWGAVHPARAARAKRHFAMVARVQKHAGRLLAVDYLPGAWGAVLRFWHALGLAWACIRAGLPNKHGKFDLEPFLADE